MILLLWNLLYLSILLGNGWLLLSVLLQRRKMPVLQILALAALLGTGVYGTFLFWLSLAGIPPGRLTLVFFSFAVAGAFLILRRRLIRPQTALPAPRQFLPALPALVLVLSVCGWVFVEAALVPLTNVDSIAIWGYKAKLLFHTPIRGTAYFSDLTRSYTHLSYPLQLPLFTAGLYGAMGFWSEQAGKMLHGFIFLGFIGFLYSVSRRYLSLAASLFLLAVYVANPLFVELAGAGIADTLLMLFYAAAVVSLVEWLQTGNRDWLILACPLHVFMLFTKNEGLALLLVNAVAVAAYLLITGERKKLLHVATVFAVTVLVSLPWLVFRSTLPQTDENYIGQLRTAWSTDTLQRLPVILLWFLRSAADVTVWGGFWLAGIVASAAAYWKRKSPRSSRPGWRWDKLAGLLLLVFILHLAVYVLVLTVTPWDLEDLLSIKAAPLLLQSSPAAYLLFCRLIRDRTPLR